MNSVILMGRLTADPDMRNTGDTSVARYSLAVDRRGKDKGADFIRCVCFGKAADFAEKYLKKGTKVVVRGRIQTGSYKDRDGRTVYTTDVILDDQEFAESKRAAEEPQDFAPVPDDDTELPFE